MRELFEFLSIFDWISPTIGLVEDLINDPTPLQSNSWTFFIPFHEMMDSGWSAWDVEGLLAAHGIKTWGSLIHRGEFHFSVKLEQAQWAEYVLNRNGVPLTELCQGPPRPKQKREQSSAQKRQKPLQHPLSFLDDLLDGDSPPFFG